MTHRWAIGALGAVLIAAAAVAPAPALGESKLRTHYGFIKSFHPGTDRDFTTWHPSAGLSAPLIGEWLRLRGGIVRTSHRTWGPFAGLTAAWEVAEGWRVGVTGGVTGNYPVGRWLRRGALPVVQWKGWNSGLIWEAGFIHRPDTTFVGLGVHVPFSLLEAK